MGKTIVAIRSVAAWFLAIGLLQPQLTRADDSQVAKVSFYFAAHEDDWQLFMNPQAFDDVLDAKSKTVFIHLTAGDAGLGVGTAMVYPTPIASVSDVSHPSWHALAHRLSLQGDLDYALGALSTGV